MIIADLYVYDRLRHPSHLFMHSVILTMRSKYMIATSRWESSHGSFMGRAHAAQGKQYPGNSEHLGFAGVPLYYLHEDTSCTSSDVFRRIFAE